MKKAERNSKNEAMAWCSAGKLRCSSVTTALISAVKVISIPPGPTVRYNSSITIRSNLSSNSRRSNAGRSGPGLSAVPKPLNWCKATSNSNRPRQKLVAHPPGTECLSSSNVGTPAFAKVAAAVKPAFPAPITITSYFAIFHSFCSVCRHTAWSLPVVPLADRAARIPPGMGQRHILTKCTGCPMCFHTKPMILHTIHSITHPDMRRITVFHFPERGGGRNSSPS